MGVTRAVTHDVGGTVIDTAQCMERSDGALFYDAVHMTIRGSRAFAECVEAGLVQHDMARDLAFWPT